MSSGQQRQVQVVLLQSPGRVLMEQHPPHVLLPPVVVAVVAACS